MNHYISSILEIPASKLIDGGIALAGGILVSALIVSYFNYDPSTKYDKDMSVDEEFKEAEYKKKAREIKQKKIEFGQKWYEELEELEDRVLSTEDLIGLRDKSVNVDTPEGVIIMFYNSTTESYWYFSDNKNVSNRTLDAVARKYAVRYNCKQVCINHKKEIENVQKRLCDFMEAQTAVAKNNQEENSDDDVFVKPKITAKKIIKRHKRVIVDRVNRFTYKGKISSFNHHKKSEEDNTNTHTKMTFQEYKESLKTKVE